MTYVVTENCIKCKYTDCVEVCPVDPNSPFAKLAALREQLSGRKE